MAGHKDEESTRIIDALGGTASVAMLCDRKMPTVSGWRVHGIPEGYRKYLEAVRPRVIAAVLDAMAEEQGGENEQQKSERQP